MGSSCRLRQAHAISRESVMNVHAALRSIVSLAVTLLLSTAANAQLFRAYLAVDGNDANPCTLPAPCRLLPAALNAVANGGEVWMLDSANYNTASVTIDKSVSILAVPGAVGSVLATGGPAFAITADGLKVALRNLVIVPLAGGGATNGVSLTGASSISIEDCLLANLPSDAIQVIGTGTLRVVNSVIRNNGGFAAVHQNGASASYSRVQLLGNTNGGVLANGNTATTTTVTLSDSIVTGGSYGAVATTTGAGAVTHALVTRSTVEKTNFALYADSFGVGSATVTVAGSTVVNNTYRWYQTGSGSVVRSFGDNHITLDSLTVGSLSALSRM